jgi:hypothetical protein
MNAKPPYQRPPSGPLSYHSPGAHQKSQWITDEGVGGRILVIVLIAVSIVAAVGGGIVAVAGFFLGWW